MDFLCSISSAFDAICARVESTYHEFHIIGDKLINPIVGVYIPIIRIPIKGGMTIPNIATFDHGTFGVKKFFFFRVDLDLKLCGKKIHRETEKNIHEFRQTYNTDGI